MATYFLRSKDGILKARLPARAALEIFDQGDGFFREAKYTNGTRKTVFEITDCGKYGARGFDVFLWEGDTIVPENG